MRITNGFKVNVFEGATGRSKYTLATDYILPTYGWIPAYQPVLATPPSGTRLYYAGAGGTTETLLQSGGATSSQQKSISMIAEKCNKGIRYSTVSIPLANKNLLSQAVDGSK